MATIDPTAVVDPGAVLADSVVIGPFAVIESDVTLGEGTVIAAHAVIRRYTALGANNRVDSFVTLGGDPQDYKFDPSQKSYVIIGDNNVFRECVTINRATGDGAVTSVGDGCYWMAYSHAGHNVTVGDHVILANGCQIAGHCTIGDGSILPSNGAIHQFCWVGEKCMFQGGAMISMHAPPYCLIADHNNLVSLNVVGLRRDPRFNDEDRRQIKEAFGLLYRSGLKPEEALAKMDACADWAPAAEKFREFVRKALSAEKPYNRGLLPRLGRSEGRRSRSATN